MPGPSSDAPAPTRVVSFYPGPAEVADEVLAAMATRPYPHRSAPFREVVGRVQSGLAWLLGTQAPVFPVLASATTTMETALRSVVRRGVLCVSSGAFGDRLSSIRVALGLPGEALNVPAGTAVQPEMLERALGAGDFDAVALVHCETSTGVLCDLPALAEVVRARPGTCLLVDAVSSLAGAPIAFDDLGAEAVLVSATSKALACPPGMSVLAISRAAAHRAEHSARGGFALDIPSLVASHDKRDTPQTPNSPLFFALDRQLQRLRAEGLDARYARHVEMASQVQTWAAERLGLFAAEGSRSPTVTVIENTRAFDVADLLGRLEQRGFRIANGYGALKNATFRIGHLGEVTPAQTTQLLAVLDELID